MNYSSANLNYRSILSWFILSIISLLFITGCDSTISALDQSTATSSVSPSETPGLTPTNAIKSTPSSEKEVAITGWLTTIWNSEPHYTITDEQMQDTTLVIEEKTVKELGGMLQFDQKRVTVTGELTNEAPRTMRVISIKLANP